MNYRAQGTNHLAADLLDLGDKCGPEVNQYKTPCAIGLCCGKGIPPKCIEPDAKKITDAVKLKKA